MMPFVHDENSPSVTISTTNGSSSGDFQKFRKDHLKSFSGYSSPSKLNKIIQRHSAPSLAEVQRKAAQRKLQMAKLIGHTTPHGGGMSGPAVDFRKHQSHHQSMMDYHNDSMQGGSRRARSNNFTLNETFALLKIWASPEMQWQMKHNFRNFRVWEAISFAMQELGHDRTAIQCKNRIQNLTSIFYRIKKSKQDYRSFNFPYYKIIGDVLDGKKNGTNASMPPNMAEFIQHFTNNATGIVSPTQSNSGSGSTSGMAAHMALVEEYQILINGNPEVTLTPTGDRNSSSNGTVNVLSPEVSISEGDSPIRMDSNSHSHSGSKNHTASNSSTSYRNSNANGSLKLDLEDGATAAEDGSIPSENDHETSDLDDGNMYADEESMSMFGRPDSYPSARGKRSMSSTGFSSFAKSGYGNGGFPAKRPRGLSSATTASTTAIEDPVSQYLSEMVDIERQWLDMERERAENERQMMMYMMQILQALVCPQEQEDETGDGTAENENDQEATENEYVDNEHDENAEHMLAEQNLEDE